jgi:hypothetical protein
VTEPAKQVSEVPIQAAAPPARGGNILLLVALFSLSGVAAGGAWWWMQSRSAEPDRHVTQWPRHEDHPFYHADDTDYEAATGHLRVLADALLAYREGPEGGGVRWPSDLQELHMLGLLDPDYDLTGRLSGAPIEYHPDMPIGYDPARWALCHDVEIGWRRVAGSGYAARGPRAAAVILADGTVKLLGQDELDLYGGLNLRMDATK